MTRKQRRITWRPLLPTIGERGQRRLHGIYSSRQLQDLVLYEKSRSDRNGTTLSLALFDVGGFTYSQRRSFITDILSIVRTTDHVGWYERGCIGVLLPYTDRSGAQVFIDHVHELAEPACAPFELYSYPDLWFENAARGTDNAGAHNGNGHSDADASGFRRVVFEQRMPAWKRSLDIAGAGVGLALLSPLFLLVAIFIKLVSPGPIIFKQKRVGIGRRQFTFYKFRTMHADNDESYHAKHAKGFIDGDREMRKLDEQDPRIIFGGRVLRRTTIDELPQLFNVLRGDMTLVGPRPCIPYEAEEYHRWHTGRFNVLPGLTGLWQVSGKNKLTFQQMIRLDIAYERRMSLRFDLWIILMTFPTVFGLVFESVLNRVRRYSHLSEQITHYELPAESRADAAGCTDPEQRKHAFAKVLHQVGT
jgi:lipopolysaccharide/colanic/teichoic acid biosynthesis glycosyltransferase